MRRTEQDFKAEVFRRSENFKKQRKKRLLKLAASLGCIALLILTLPMLKLGMGGSAEKSDSAVFDSLYGNGAPEAPAAEQKSESFVMGATGAAPMDAEPGEMVQPEDGAVSDMTVWCVAPDGTEDEWRVRDVGKIEAIVSALRGFEDIPVEKSRLEGISEEEGNTVYVVTFTEYDEETDDLVRHTYQFYPDHDALWYAFDGGYWVGCDEQAAKKLLEALQNE